MKVALDMNRRDLLRHALILAGSSAALSGCDWAKDAGPFRLERDQFDLLASFADTMIPATDTPGALDVGVPRLFEGLLANWASAQRRGELLGALATIGKLGGNFVMQTPEQRNALLAGFDADAMARTGELNDLSFKDPAYAQLKELVVTLYYLSEPALTEELAYDHDPGRWDPSVEVTAETRQFGGL